jgi:hypothetical protein
MATQQNFAVLSLLGASARTTSADGSAVDLQGYTNPGGNRAMKAYLDVGAITTATVLTAKVQHSDTTTAADFTDAASFTVVPVSQTTPSNNTIHFSTTKRYVRGVFTVTNGGGISFGMYLLAEKRAA